MIIALLLSAVLLYLAFRGVNWQELLGTLRQGQPAYLGLAFILLSISCVVRGLRWRVLLSAEKTLPPMMVFWANMIGYLGNSFLPARAGEVVRVVLIGQRGGVSKSFALATALTERIMDSLILVLLSVVALLVLGSVPELEPALRVMAVVGVVGVAGVFLAPRLGWLGEKLVARLPLSPARREKANGMLSSFLQGTAALQHPGRLGMFSLFSVAIWSLDMLTAMQVARAFQLSLSPLLALLELAALGLSSAVPSTPGYVGVYQFVTVSVLTPFGFTKPQALAFILAYQAVNYAVISLWGLLGMWRLQSNLFVARPKQAE